MLLKLAIKGFSTTFLQLSAIKGVLMQELYLQNALMVISDHLLYAMNHAMTVTTSQRVSVLRNAGMDTKIIHYLATKVWYHKIGTSRKATSLKV